MAQADETKGALGDAAKSRDEDLNRNPNWKDKQHDVEDEARRTASRAQGMAGNYAASKFDQHRDQLCHTLDNVAKALETGEGELERSDLSRLTQQAASQIRRFKDNIERREGDDVIGSATNLLRDRPVTSVMTGLLAGFALSRAIKATPQTAGNSDTGSGQQNYGGSSDYGSSDYGQATSSGLGAAGTSSATGAYTGSEGYDPSPTPSKGSKDTSTGTTTDDTPRYNAE
ncbi:MAG: hypothetical protein V2I43_27785 [Parvularcula sp.]|nr:hypothetical protein [Parvularcula sp.]